jgi:hypothetical protein
VSVAFQILPQIVAEELAGEFLSMKLSLFLVYVALLVEKTGLMEVVVILSRGLTWIVRGHWLDARPRLDSTGHHTALAGMGGL